jgi:DNA-binding response OmpR family regulator
MTRAVLIVDDSLTVRMDLAEAIEAAGFRPLPCATAAEAREALSREAVSLVILDVRLPDADGVELLKELRTNPSAANAPVLMLSSEAEVKDRIRALQTGADEYVGKPYDTGHVVARVGELIRGREGSSSAEKVTILVIDDSPTFREELTRTLQSAGYSVLTASSGEEGLRIAAIRRPSAIVIDGVMPGIDGGTVIRKIRLDLALRGTPCVLLTASEEGGAELRALDAGADAFVRKEEDLDVILARIAAMLRSAGTRTEQTASLLGPKRILAVDDSITYLQELAAMLRNEGYDVVLARSGEEAIEMLSVQSVDCILLDLLMPGLGGKETCRRIKASPVVRDVPLIMLTALEDRDAMIDGLSMGADDYISKSSESEVLKARVRAQIRRKQLEDEHRRVRETLLRRELEASEARAAGKFAEARAALAEELERKNTELEAFNYSVSHDLQAPLRSIDGFSQALLEDYSGKLDDKGRDYLQRVRASAQRMGELIDDLLQLSRVSRADLCRDRVNLSDVARLVSDELQRQEPEPKVAFAIQEGLFAEADSRLIRVLFDNLLGNAQKFTSKIPAPRIEFGAEERDGSTAYFVRDNGAGFNMAYAQKLFSPFQRLHSEADFPGTGIGLATVRRIIGRYGGRTWAEGEVGRGATVFFTIPLAPPGGRK